MNNIAYERKIKRVYYIAATVAVSVATAFMATEYFLHKVVL